MSAENANNGRLRRRIVESGNGGREMGIGVDHDELFFETGRFNTRDFVIENTILPNGSGEIPHVIGLVGPARGGTTAFGLLMAGHPDIQRSHFQPWKKLLRHGTDYGRFDLRSSGVVVAKDTFGPLYQEENFDPVEMLTSAGVPKEKQTWIVTLRNPHDTYASLLNFTPMDANFYAETQMHAIHLYEQYRSQGWNMIPFSFDLIGHPDGEKVVMDALMRRAGLSELPSLEFDKQRIDQRMDWGEAYDTEYYDMVIRPTLGNGGFKYVGRTVDYTKSVTTREETDVLENRCMDSYLQFARLAMKELDL